jgi:hypothetical protein
MNLLRLADGIPESFALAYAISMSLGYADDLLATEELAIMSMFPYLAKDFSLGLVVRALKFLPLVPNILLIMD